MAEGKVKWFNTRKGYGFIATDDGKDIFVHYSNIAADGYKTLAEGDPVTFDVAEGEKGLRAENVVPKGKSAPKTEAPKAKPAPKKKSAPKAEEKPEAEEAPEEEAPEEEEEPAEEAEEKE